MNKILAICTSPDKGGLELYFVKLVKYFYSKKFSIISVCQRNSPISKIIPSPIIYIEKLSYLNILYNVYLISKKIKKENINIIHVSWAKDLLLAVLIKVFSKTKISIIYYRQMKITRYKKDIYHRFIYKNIDKILVITKQLESDCQKYLPVSNDKIIHLKYGIQAPEQKTDISDKENIFDKLGLNTNSFTLGIFSRLEVQKGQHLVIEAINSITEKDIQLAINKLISGRTVITIAHKLNNFKQSSNIAVMNKGEITEYGTHKNLLNKNGIYKNIYDLQTTN